MYTYIYIERESFVISVCMYIILGELYWSPGRRQVDCRGRDTTKNTLLPAPYPPAPPWATAAGAAAVGPGVGWG